MRVKNRRNDQYGSVISLHLNTYAIIHYDNGVTGAASWADLFLIGSSGHRPLDPEHLKVCLPCSEVAISINWAKRNYVKGQQMLARQRFGQANSLQMAFTLRIIKSWRGMYRNLMSRYGGVPN